MAKFKVTRNMPLDFLGEGWKDCFLKFNVLTIGEMREFGTTDFVNTKAVKIIDQALVLLKSKFIEGTGLGENGELVKVEKEDFDNLPSEVLNRAVSFLVGELERKNV